MGPVPQGAGPFLPPQCVADPPSVRWHTLIPTSSAHPRTTISRHESRVAGHTLPAPGGCNDHVDGFLNLLVSQVSIGTVPGRRRNNADLLRPIRLTLAQIEASRVSRIEQGGDSDFPLGAFALHINPGFDGSCHASSVAREGDPTIASGSGVCNALPTEAETRRRTASSTSHDSGTLAPSGTPEARPAVSDPDLATTVSLPQRRFDMLGRTGNRSGSQQFHTLNHQQPIEGAGVAGMLKGERFRRPCSAGARRHGRALICHPPGRRRPQHNNLPLPNENRM